MGECRTIRATRVPSSSRPGRRRGCPERRRVESSARPRPTRTTPTEVGRGGRVARRSSSPTRRPDRATTSSSTVSMGSRLCSCSTGPKSASMHASGDVVSEPAVVILPPGTLDHRRSQRRHDRSPDRRRHRPGAGGAMLEHRRVHRPRRQRGHVHGLAGSAGRTRECGCTGSPNIPSRKVGSVASSDRRR